MEIILEGLGQGAGPKGWPGCLADKVINTTDFIMRVT